MHRQTVMALVAKMQAGQAPATRKMLVWLFMLLKAVGQQL